MTPAVSIVTATKNYARFLPTAVESVLAQTYRHWELLVIDDGSADDTPAAVRPYLADRRVRYVQSDRLGQSRAKNLGVSLGRGEFVAFLDADDAWLPAKLEKQLAELRANPTAGVCYTRRSLMDEAGRPLPTPAATFPRGRVLPELFVRNFVCFSSVLVRRTVFEHVGGFDPTFDLAIDYDLWLRVARHFEFAFVNEELVRYRTGHANLSRRLGDRVDAAMAMMTRAVDGRGLRAELPAGVVAEGFASTCRTMAWTLRRTDPRRAARWYLRALLYGGDRLAAAKGLLGVALDRVRPSRRGSASPG